jgi:hypothetical protein
MNFQYIFSIAKPIFSGFRFFSIKEYKKSGLLSPKKKRRLPHDVEVVDIIGLKEERLAFSFHGHQNETTLFLCSHPSLRSP